MAEGGKKQASFSVQTLILNEREMTHTYYKVADETRTNKVNATISRCCRIEE